MVFIMKNSLKFIVFLMMFVNLQSSYSRIIDNDSSGSDYTTDESDNSLIFFDVQGPDNSMIPFDGKRLKSLLKEYKMGDFLQQPATDNQVRFLNESPEKRQKYIMEFYISADQQFLLEAVKNNNVQAVEKALLDGTDINTQDDQGQTPLEIAIINNCNSCISLLIKAGANIDRLNKDGITPLHIAAINNNIGAILLLFDAGAFIDAQCMDQGEHQGETPLHFAVLNDATEAVRMLLNAGADETIVNKDGKTAQQLMTVQQIWKNREMNNIFLFVAMPGIKEILEQRKFNVMTRKQFGNFKSRSMISEILQGPITK